MCERRIGEMIPEQIHQLWLEHEWQHNKFVFGNKNCFLIVSGQRWKDVYLTFFHTPYWKILPLSKEPANPFPGQ